MAASRSPAATYREDTLVVHPFSLRCHVLQGNSRLTTRLVSPTPNPHKCVTLLVPVLGRLFDRLTERGPRLEPATLQGQRMRHHRPRLT
jgi:hypothetical protein